MFAFYKVGAEPALFEVFSEAKAAQIRGRIEQVTGFEIDDALYAFPLHAQGARKFLLQYFANEFRERMLVQLAFHACAIIAPGGKVGRRQEAEGRRQKQFEPMTKDQRPKAKDQRPKTKSVRP